MGADYRVETITYKPKDFKNKPEERMKIQYE